MYSISSKCIFYLHVFVRKNFCHAVKTDQLLLNHHGKLFPKRKFTSFLKEVFWWDIWELQVFLACKNNNNMEPQNKNFSQKNISSSSAQSLDLNSGNKHVGILRNSEILKDPRCCEEWDGR